MPADVYSSFANYLHLISGNLLISDEGWREECLRLSYGSLESSTIDAKIVDIVCCRCFIINSS